MLTESGIGNFAEKEKVLWMKIFRVLLRQLSAADLKKTHFKCREINMERLGKREVCITVSRKPGVMWWQREGCPLLSGQPFPVCSVPGVR